MNFIIGSAISADTLLTKADCTRSAQLLKDLKSCLPNSNLSDEDKKMYDTIIESGLGICDRDFEQLPD